jgi:quercetin dioxygenase-like cupin family protein
MNAVSSIRIIRAGEGEVSWAMGERFTFKIGPEETGGAFTLAEVIAQPRNGPPPHLHHREDELFYVAEGDFRFVLGEDSFRGPAGSAAYLPKGVLHTYSNTGQKPGKILVIATPSGFEEFIRSWARPAAEVGAIPPIPTQDDIDKLMAAAPAFGIELHPEVQFPPESLRPRTDRSHWVLGQFVTTKLTARETSGNFSVVEVISPPGAAVPNHVHLAMDEIFYLLEGAVHFSFGDHEERVDQGGLVFVPRGEVHGFRNAGPTPSRMLDLHTPGGFEAFFAEAGIPATTFDVPPPAGPAPDWNQLLSLFRKHGMEIPGTESAG